MVQSAQPNPQAVAGATVEERSAFLVRTYLHLVAALLAFIGIEAFLLVSGIASMITETVLGAGRFGWLIFLVMFMGVSWIADRWARSDTSQGMQYAGLGLYTVAEAVIFAPLVVLAVTMSLQEGEQPFAILGQAGIISVILFGGLTGVVLITRKDFSFLRGILMFGFLAAMVLIGASLIFGFTLGLIFMWAMVLLAAGSILYNTSNVLHYYRTDQHVAASLQLFASFALLLYYVLMILLSRR
ncbi:MAG: Bax inhibitor-1 family protein [Polyangiales bacterium]